MPMAGHDACSMPWLIFADSIEFIIRLFIDDDGHSYQPAERILVSHHQYQRKAKRAPTVEIIKQKYAPSSADGICPFSHDAHAIDKPTNATEDNLPVKMRTSSEIDRSSHGSGCIIFYISDTPKTPAHKKRRTSARVAAISLQPIEGIICLIYAMAATADHLLASPLASDCITPIDRHNAYRPARHYGYSKEFAK